MDVVVNLILSHYAISDYATLHYQQLIADLGDTLYRWLL